MSVAASRSIPRTTPSLIARIEHGLDWTHEPVIGRGLVATAGRARRSASPSLLVADTSGVVCFRRELPPARPAAMPGRPFVGERTRIVVISGERLVVQSYADDGALADEWALPPILPEALSLSLNARIVDAGGGRVVVGWCEDNQTWRNELRDAEDGRVLRAFPGRLLAETDEVLVLSTFDVTGRAVAGRRKSDGEELWSLPTRGGVISAGGNGILLVDDGAPRERWQAAETLVEIDASTGRVRWERGFDGEITSALRARHVTCVAEVRGDGSVDVHRIAADGTLLGTSTWAPLLPRPGVPVIASDASQVLALDHTFLLGIHGTRLLCEVIGDPGQMAWTMEMPEGSGRHATVADGTIAIAGLDSLTIHAERS